jgi:hypothetical protein
MRTHAQLAIPVLLSFACTTARQLTTDAPEMTRSASVALINPMFINAAELRATGASNAYDAILQIRPAFFATRGGTSFINEPPDAIVVIVDRRATGGVSELRNLSTAIIKSIKRLSAAEVFNMTGRSAPAGGIEVVMGR